MGAAQLSAKPLARLVPYQEAKHSVILPALSSEMVGFTMTR
jgi:hypothetical protein